MGPFPRTNLSQPRPVTRMRADAADQSVRKTPYGPVLVRPIDLGTNGHTLDLTSTFKRRRLHPVKIGTHLRV